MDYESYIKLLFLRSFEIEHENRWKQEMLGRLKNVLSLFQI